MKTEAARKVIKTSTQEQQENLKNTRKTLKVLQHSAAKDKENLAGRPIIEKEHKLASDLDKEEVKRKKLSFVNKSVQTDESAIPDKAITLEDLTSDEPSENYWKKLAEKRQQALNDSLQENERLKDNIEALKEENRICKEMLDESRNMVEILQEMLSEADTTTELGEEALEQS